MHLPMLVLRRPNLPDLITIPLMKTQTRFFLIFAGFQKGRETNAREKYVEERELGADKKRVEFTLL